MDTAPQLAGLFAGGMPKLKKRGGVNTGGTSILLHHLQEPPLLTIRSGPRSVLHVRFRNNQIVSSETAQFWCTETTCRSCTGDPRPRSTHSSGLAFSPFDS